MGTICRKLNIEWTCNNCRYRKRGSLRAPCRWSIGCLRNNGWCYEFKPRLSLLFAELFHAKRQNTNLIMVKSMKRVIGWGLIVIPLVSIVAISVIAAGWKIALIVWGVAALLIAMLICGIALLR